MLKPTTLNIADTNLANFGTDLEYKIKQAAAEGEPAFKQFVGGATTIDAPTGAFSSRTFLWRVHNFKLEEVSGDKTANFFRGDCYLVLSITGSKTAPVFTIFYWIGTDSSIDEAGTVAYKAFELDNVLSDRAHGVNAHAVQYREVCGDESENFRNVFSGMRVLEGGYDSGFHHVEKPERKSRLLRVYTDHLIEVPFKWESLCANGVFILDAGTTLYQWSGRKAPLRLKVPAMAAVRLLDDERPAETQTIVLSEGVSSDDYSTFATFLGSTGTPTPEEVNEMKHLETGRGIRGLSMLRVSKYVDGKFQYVADRPLSNDNDGAIYIEDNNVTCTVHGKLPLAALCAMAYFVWADKRPMRCEFAK